MTMLSAGIINKEYSLSFDGVDDYVQTPIGADVGSGEFAIGGWLKLNTTPSERSTLVATFHDGGGFILGPIGYSGGDFRFWVGGDELRAGTSKTGTWYHLVGVRDANGNATMYLNGDVIGTMTSSASVSNSYDVSIGREPTTDDGGYMYLDGILTDVRYFNGPVPTQSDVQTWMNGDEIGSEAIAYPVDEGSGSSLHAYGSVGSSNTATINGATWSEETP